MDVGINPNATARSNGFSENFISSFLSRVEREFDTTSPIVDEWPPVWDCNIRFPHLLGAPTDSGSAWETTMQGRLHPIFGRSALVGRALVSIWAALQRNEVPTSFG